MSAPLTLYQQPVQQTLNSDQGASCDGTQKEGLRPAMYKTVQPPLNDLNFRSICANTETRVCLGHIRAASGTAVTLVNNHPFCFGRHGESGIRAVSYTCLRLIISFSVHAQRLC